MRLNAGRKRQLLVGVLLLLLLTTALYLLTQQQQRGSTRTEEPATRQQTQRKIRFWTCSMHPQIKLPEAGKCPICNMDLIPVYEEPAEEEEPAGEEAGVSQITLSETARRLAGIETSTASYRPLTVEFKILGRIDYDETTMANIAAWVPGRIDKLYKNFVGDSVSKGEILLQVYSPELRVGQEEYLLFFKRLQDSRKNNNPQAVSSNLAVKEAVQKKLELWGILPEQIRELEARGTAEDRLNIYAPTSGVIVEREAFEGKYFQSGDSLFKIADLSSLWVKFDIYEKDLSFVKVGQPVTFEVESYPGEPFTGKIVFIDPFVSETLRTIKVRGIVSNQKGKLKPGMFVRAVLKQSLGDRLSIPLTAPLLTGKRAVVYVEKKKGESRVYQLKEVTLGPRTGDFYPVITGLQNGDIVVTRGNFFIDASLQIQAKPNMMNTMDPEKEVPKAGTEPAAIRHH